MATATIIFSDDDINIGRYKVDVNVADAHTADGLASAAHVTSMFIASVVNTPAFAEGAAAYGQAKGFSMRKDSPVTVALTLTDVDLDAGAYQMEFDVVGEAEIEQSVTAAYLTAAFIRDAMPTNEFKVAVTDYAHTLVEGRSDATVNDNNGPAAEATADQEAA